MSIRREIDKDGDLILVLSRLGLDDSDVAEDGEDDVDADAKLLEYEKLQNKEVRVSSKVLMLNSPVFKAMLGGKFKESAELAKSTGLSLPYSLDLPDDDAEAMSILSQILHNAYVTERPKPIGLARLAFVSDKGLVNPMTWTWDISQNPCVRSAKALASYIETLRKSNILSKDIDFATHKFCNLLSAAVDLPTITMMDFSCIREVGVCGCRSNKYANRNLSYEVEKEAKLIIQQRRVFNCLDCLKSEVTTFNLRLSQG
ncbi:hypothetical protein CSAL01_08114 [Colletotrichum salicis]|uniref:BTB domain-containing protein n=1 Tax=Colletotrichum salicis TaxID=1209931 RepID=A0A135U150_9PEZI|nr:hypothetical protein CSAL01_08114 [Colletotrichum salicis]